MTPKQFQQAVLDWYDRHGRKDLPWQENINPYRVWISEIMLQQTQVSTVIPYYQRFMESFPTVETLAAAEIDEVLHHWTGLGYYARARNLHRAAQQIVSEYHGQLPATVEQLSEFPGIGRSTAGAICALAHKLRAPILDGNVKRVLARFAAIDGWPGQTQTLNKLWALSESLTPHSRVDAYTQVMMDLGATVCARSKPDCQRCPLAKNCQAFVQGNPQDYPGKKPKKTLPVRNKLFLLLRNKNGETLLLRNPPSGLWGGLWVLPDCETEAQIDATCKKLGFAPAARHPQTTRRHTFSHFHLDYSPVLIDGEPLARIEDAGNQCWYHPDNSLSLGLPTPVKLLLEEYPPSIPL